jgi:hypothetical protein
MPPLSYELINHFRELQPALLRLQLEATLNARDFSLEVRHGGQSLVLRPQFTQPVPGGAVIYVDTFSPAVKRFIGWRPAYDLRWPLSEQKLAFKQFMLAHQLPTPRHWLAPEPGLPHVIVKKNRSSFSEGIRGPFVDAAGVTLDAQQGEYLEEFKPGDIIKVWYWNSEPVAAEETEMLSVVGDGISSIGDIIACHVFMLGIASHDPKQYEGYLAYQGRTLRTVLRRGEVCAVEFRYNSELPTLRMRDIRIGAEPFHGLEGLLKAAGHHLWNTIPADRRQDVVFAVDAMLDGDKKLWFLEMNSNPYVHPYVYPHMMRSIKARLVAPQNAGGT